MCYGYTQGHKEVAAIDSDMHTVMMHSTHPMEFGPLCKPDEVGRAIMTLMQ